MNDNHKLLVAFDECVRNNIDDLKLKSNGEFIGLCPFHKDENASFGGNLNKGVYHCHTCNEKGHAFELLKHFNYDMNQFKNGHISSNSVKQIHHQKQGNSSKKKVPNNHLKTLKKTIDSNNDIIVDLPEKLSNIWSKVAWNELGVKYHTTQSKLVFPITNEEGDMIQIYYHKPNPHFVKGIPFQAQIYPLHLIKHFDPNEVTYIVEGLKDVLTMRSMGYQAISSTNGQAIPKDLSAIKHLNHFCMIPDNDKSGEQLRDKWCNALIQLGKKPSACNWSELNGSFDLKTDVSDIPKNTLSELIATATYHIPETYTNNTNIIGGFKLMSLTNFINEDDNNLEHIVEDLLTENGVLIIAGTDGVGKSILASQLGLCISMGENFLSSTIHKDVGFETKRRNVLLINFELQDSELRRRIKMQDKGLRGNTTLLSNQETHFRVSLRDKSAIFTDKWDDIENTLKTTEDLRGGVLIIDNLYTSTDLELSDNKDLTPVLSRIESLKQKYNVSIILIAHFNKTQKGDILDKMHIQGGKKLTNYVDNILLIGKSQAIPELAIGKIAKVRSGNSSLQGIPFQLRLDDETLLFYKCGIVKNEEAHFNGSTTNREIEVLLKMKPSMTKILNTDFDLFTSEEYGKAMDDYNDYASAERTKFNWINKLIKLGVVSKHSHNQYHPHWELIEENI
jgi:5S rRNA maturation endonuclease (ribonuclease M5)